MSDNLKALKEQVELQIDPNGAPGSILAENHKDILDQVLTKTGKYTGFAFTANKTIASIATGNFSWNSNAMNETNEFVVKFSKLTSDLNDIGKILDLMSQGSIIRFKDFLGRSVLLEYQSSESAQDGSNNDIYDVTVKGYAENIDYTYQDGETAICVIDFYIKSAGGNGDLTAPSFQVYGTSLGKYNAGDTVPGFPTIQEQVRDLGQKITQPVFTNPTGSISSNMSASLLYEIGETLVMNLTTAFTANDGGNLSAISIELDDTEIATASPLNSYNLPITGVTKKIDATLDYLAGTGTKDTTPPTTPVPNPIGAGSIDTNDLNYSGIHPVFIFISDTDPTIDQTLVGLATKLMSGNLQTQSTGTIIVNFATGGTPKYLVFGYPATSTTKTSWFVNALNNGLIGGGSNLFGDAITLNIDSPDIPSRWSTVPYKFHKTNFATILNDNIELRN